MSIGAAVDERGPHHTKPTTTGVTVSFFLTVGDNIGKLRDWHHTKHLLTWADCPAEPCNHLEPEFRKCWQEVR